MARDMDVDVAAGVEMPRSFGSARRAEWPSEMWHESVELECGGVFLSLVSNVGDRKPGMTDFFLVGELIPRPQLNDDLNDFTSASAAHMTVTNTWMNTHTELEFPTVPVVWFNTVLYDDNGKTIVQKLWVIELMDCGLVQDDIRARMKAGGSLVDLMTPMTSTVASVVDSLVAPWEVSLVAPMASMMAPLAPLVASMASMASMLEALDWLKRLTAESKSDDEQVDGWTHKFREELIAGLTLKIDGERADGLTHKIREELIAELIFLDGVVQVVTWARTKTVESLVDSMALMALIASTVAMMVASMMATMVAPMASSRSKEEKTARGDRAVPRKDARMAHDATVQQWR